MADDLEQLETWAGQLLGRLQPAERAGLARTVARDLRRSQQRRISTQRNPDGTPYAPRRPRTEPMRSRRGAIRRRKTAMFTKLRTARWLKIRATAEGVEVGFYGRVARLARVHQKGLRDRVDRGGPVVDYAQRQLLGFSEADRAMIRDRLLDHLGR